MFAIATRTVQRHPQRIPALKPTHCPVKKTITHTSEIPLGKIAYPLIQKTLITDRATRTRPEEYKGTGKLFIHGSTASDLANIRDNGIAGRLYLGEISAYPLTPKDTETVLNTKGYARYAAQQKEMPAMAVFELMHHKDNPNHTPILLDDRRETLYFQTENGQAALRLIAVLDHNEKPLELPKEGYRTRREGSSAFWMSLSWYGPMFVGVSAIAHLGEALQSQT